MYILWLYTDNGKKTHFVKTRSSRLTKRLFFVFFFCNDFFLVVVVRCAELLVMKAELELMQGEREESGLDLDKVRHLLDICSGLENPSVCHM